MKLKSLLGALVAGLAAVVNADSYHGMTYSTGDVEPGVWNADYAKAKDYADKNGNPIIVFWGNTGCGHCERSEQSIGGDKTLANWLKENEIVLSISIGGNDKFPNSSQAKKFAGPSGSFPFVRWYWKDESGTVHSKKTQSDMTGAKMLSIAKEVFAGWSPALKSAGEFPKSSAYSRLEAEEGTKSVDFTMTRVPTEATAAKLVIKALVGGKEISSKPLVWKKDQLSQDVSVDISKATGLKDGDEIELQVLATEEATKALAKTTVTWVAKPSSAANPKWIGEDFGFGEWTMDLDAAKRMVAETEGAFTLVSVQGSLWCPDCANTDRNFLDLEEDGVNLFKAWAKENKVALVTLDIPNFGGADPSPTLLSRTPYETTLARNKYVDKEGKDKVDFKEKDIGKTVFPLETPELTGADPALTQPFARSGLGYLTRKGVSDAEAAEVLARNQKLVTKNTAEGGFHRPEDTRKTRTGVPIFVLLRRDGSVAGRFTTFASTSPFKADRANFTYYVERIEELMLVADDEDEIENNDASSTAATLPAMGGLAAGSVSHADAQDFYRLEDVQAGALQKVSLRAAVGLATGTLKVELRKNGKAVASAIGTLDVGIDVEATVDDAAADWTVVVRPDATDEAFAAASKATTLRSYLLTTAVVLRPTNAVQTYEPTLDTIAIRVERGEIYRLVGVAPVQGVLVQVTNEFYQAWVDGDVPVEVVGDEIEYQHWETGSVGFGGVGMAVSGSAGKVEIPVVREGGTTGRVVVEAKLDLARSVCTGADGEPGYVDYEDKTFVWEEGEGSAFKLPITLRSGVDYGEEGGKYVFTLNAVEGMTAITPSEFVLTVSPSVIAGPGKVAFAGEEKLFVRASEGAVLSVERWGGADGAVAANVKTTYGTLEPAKVSWGSQELTARTVTLTGVPAGKTAKLSFSGFSGGLTADKGAKTVSVTAVADDAPAFVQPEFALTGYDNVKFSAKCGLVGVDGAKEVSFKKIAGSLPKGLSARWEGDASLLIEGIPTKAGAYEAVYQVIATRGRTKVSGLTAKIAITIVDPTVANPEHPELMPINATCLTKREFSDVMVVSTCERKLLGTLSFQIPKGSTGKVSGKYVSAAGTVSFKAPKAWASMDGSTLVAVAEGNRDGYRLTVKALANGAVEVALDDPAHADCELEARVSEPWTADDSAENWQGYYTVALSNETSAAGYGVMTLKMTSASDWKKGLMGWTLVLPNGKSFSGKSALTRGDETYAYLPVFASKNGETFSAVLRILANAEAQKDQWRASVLSPEPDDFRNFCLARWSDADGGEVAFGIYGGIYDTDEDLDACCVEYYEKTDLHFAVDGEAVASVKISKDAIKLSGDIPNEQKVKLSFSRKTGVLSGTFVLPGTVNTKVSWSGVVLIGWGEGCGCKDPKTPIFLPFVAGSYSAGGAAVGLVEIK